MQNPHQKGIISPKFRHFKLPSQLSRLSIGISSVIQSMYSLFFLYFSSIDCRGNTGNY